MKKLIEVALPLAEINAKTIKEKTLAAGHPANLHLWWGRSPISSVQSALAASLIDAPESDEELKSRLVHVQSGEDSKFGKKPTIFDPFCGFGGIPLAAQSLGLPVVAGDLNPLAVMLAKAATEIPARFANQSSVNPSAPRKRYSGTEGLAEDVAYYGNMLREKAWEKLRDIYPNEPDSIPSAWIWTRTVKCPNPACGHEMPLANSFVLYAKGENEIWAEPILQNGTIHFELRHGCCPKEKKSNKIGSQGAVFQCPVCGSLTTDAYVKQMGASHELGAQMMAISMETENGIQYIPPTALQQQAADVPIPEDVPPGEMPDNPHWFTPPGFGLKNYADLFSPRQLTMLTTLCELLSKIQDKAASDALAAGMEADGGSLSNGGKGALAYGQAIGVYLAFVIDKIADANSTICSWRSTGNSLRNTFGRQAIPMVWTYAEGNPFSRITGNLSSMLKSIVNTIRNLPIGSEVSVVQQDARVAPYPQDVMVCTELPYYKAIDYATLSDYFYVWLRKSLKNIYPDLFNPMVTNKDELSTCGQYYGKDTRECEKLYEEQMQNTLLRLAQCANEDFPQLFFFEFHKKDELALAGSNADFASPWETLIGSMLHAGYEITAVWPMRSAAASEKADGTRVLIVARIHDKTEQTTRRGFAATLKKDFPTVFERMLCAGVDTCDEKIVGIGAGLSLFTRYKKILNASGSDMKIHDGLELIYQEIIEYLDEKNTEDGADTAQSEEE